MQNTRVFLMVFFLLFLTQGNGIAQIHVSNEVGVLAGPAGFFTDYGERWNVRNNLENEGFGVGVVHYLSFAYKARCTCERSESWFSDHFRIRNEFDYLRSKLEHFGPVANGKGEGARKLRAMHGFTETYELGTHLEYHFMRIKDFTNFAVLFGPYVSLGVHYVYYTPTAYSDLGPVDDPKILFPSFQGGLDLEPSTTFAISGSVGVRYRLGMQHDLLIDARWNYYNSDFIDGLDVQGPQNKYNDWIFWLNVGYVFYINF
ncbi:glutamate dehydrogenase [Zunongwangia sp. H14]|uniref:THC0290_0291 family protein n=1 Tax=Zunongwangia sp. H14 TaxID=3240792 RepID=UPI003568B6DC